MTADRACERTSRAPRMPNCVLRDLREERGQTRAEFADSMAGIAREIGADVYPDWKYVERLESGDITWPGPVYRMILEKLCGRPARQLGFRSRAQSELEADAPSETSARVNSELRYAVWAKDMGIAEFAREIGVNPKTAERWITQRRIPHPLHRWKAAQVLGRDESELWPDAVPLRGTPHRRAISPNDGKTASVSKILPVHPQALNLAPDADLHERITGVIERNACVDSTVIEWLERCLAEHRRVEDSTGAVPLVNIIRAQLSALAGMAREARRPLSDSVVDLAAQYAQFMAWLCNDLQDKAAALVWYDRSHDWAIEAADVNMAATTLSMKAHLAWSVGDAVRCVRLGEAARWNDNRTSLGVQGMASQMIARGYALDADANKAHRALDETEILIKSAGEHPEDEPAWMYFYGETWFTAQRGMIETELAERGVGDARYAVSLLRNALRDLPESYRRDRAWYGAMLARAHAAGNDYDAAADTALKFSEDAVAVNPYAASDLRNISARLTRLGTRDARDLADVLSETKY